MYSSAPAVVALLLGYTETTQTVVNATEKRKKWRVEGRETDSDQSLEDTAYPSVEGLPRFLADRRKISEIQRAGP